MYNGLLTFRCSIIGMASFPRSGVTAIKLSDVGAGHARDEGTTIAQISRAWPAPTASLCLVMLRYGNNKAVMLIEKSK